MFADAGLALSVFVATDIDDLLLLAAFFAERRLATRAIVGGQFAGIAALVLISALAASLALTIPPAWVALLGLVPLGMGLTGLWRVWHPDADEDDEVDEARQAELQAEQKLRSQWLAVAAVTIANGGDNLGAYIPLFAHSPGLIPVFTAIFALMTGLWCALGYWLVRARSAGQALQRYGKWLLPCVLIALGLVILVDARVLLR